MFEPAMVTYDDDRISGWRSGAADITPVFDADGNMTTGPLGGIAETFVYDARNRLTDAGTSSYVYDAEDRRISKTEGGVTTTYVHDPHAPLSQLLQKTTNGVTTYYVYAGGQLLYSEAADQITVHHFDARGSTRALSNDAGSVTGRIAYGTYGEIVDVTGIVDTPFLYNGAYGVQTDANGLLHMRARYYSPELRRFINADPIGFGGGMNWYAYGNGNPVMYMDPEGEFGILGAVGGAVLGGIVGAVVAHRTGGDVLAAAAGGAVTGGLIGSGAGMVAGLSKGATILNAMAVGGASSAVGDVSTQVITNLRSGQNVSEAFGSIDYAQTGIAAGTGTAFGAFGGASLVFSNSLRQSTVGIQATMNKHLTVRTAEINRQKFGNSPLSAINGMTLKVQGMITTGSGRAARDMAKNLARLGIAVDVAGASSGIGNAWMRAQFTDLDLSLKFQRGK